MLAGELALAGVDVVVVERRDGQEVDGSRAGGLLARTLDVLDQRGIADRFLAEGTASPAQGFAHMPLDVSAAANDNRCLHPWDRASARSRRHGPSPTRSSTSSTRDLAEPPCRR